MTFKIFFQDISFKTCKKSNKFCAGVCAPSVTDTSDVSHDQTCEWRRPHTLDELQALMVELADQQYRLVFGNTGFGQS